MAHPVLWSRCPFFYPIGNTPPTCLTPTLAPDEHGQILLLGCGDPRSLLYTVYANLGQVQRKIDFTCCDIEPAILARNILLLTLASDGIASSICWKIFYHLYLDDETLQLLEKHCEELVKQAVNIDTWNSSKYGIFLRFGTVATLSHIRKLWQNYMKTSALPEKDKTPLTDSFTKSMKVALGNLAGLDMSTIRAAGPLSTSAAIEAGTKVFKLYWSKGFTTAHSSKNTPSPNINPLFAYSLAGRTFNVHYGTNPVSAFHLAPALVQLKGQPPLSKRTAEDLVETAMKQFSDWCSSLRTKVTSLQPNLVVRFFVGDCLALCRALHLRKTEGVLKTGIYLTPWSASHVEFEATDYGSTPSSSSAPLSFNVIDTSNLSDHLGLVNLLLVTIPLLQRKAWSVLYTNTLVQHRPGPATSSLSENLFADIPTMSLFLGVAPSSHLSHFTTHSSKDEEVSSAFMTGGASQFHQSISWRFPSAVAPRRRLAYPELDDEAPLLVCEEEKLADLMFSVYKNMFAEEDLSHNLRNTSLSTLDRRSIVHYNRGSFVLFLAYIRSRVRLNWEKSMVRLMGRIERDQKLIATRPSYQDLICQLYLHDLFTLDTLRWEFTKKVRSSLDIFNGWKEVPPVVSVTLQVPRSALRELECMQREEIGTPVLLCETKGANALSGPVINLHASINACFGTLSVAGEHDQRSISIVEDEEGWEGSSSLLVSFDAASWMFTKQGNISMVVLSFSKTQPVNMIKLGSKLGSMDLKIFSASVVDKQHIFISRYRPNTTNDICRPEDSSTAGQPQDDGLRRRLVSVAFERNVNASSLTIKEDIRSPDAIKTLSAGAVVSTDDVADTGVLVTFKDFETLLRYPYPMRTGHTKTKVARKSSYVQVEGPIRADFEVTLRTDLSVNLFPIARTAIGFNLINIHYVNLDQLPAIQLPVPPTSLSWLQTHLTLMFADRERESQNSGAPQAQRGMIVNLKESITSIFYKWSALDTPSARLNTLGLSSPTNGGVYTLIFVNALRLDLSSQTVVIDACVIPLTENNGQRVMGVLKRGRRLGLTEILTLDDEMKTWKALLPAFAERCRTWEHGDECEYKKIGIPASGNEVTLCTKSPLCSCGLGQNLGAFGEAEDWKNVQSDATRVAISPLFSHTLLSKFVRDTVARTAGGDSTSDHATNACARCGGDGDPKLLVCAACKKVKYCSQTCQRAHWRQHKPNCRKLGANLTFVNSLPLSFALEHSTTANMAHTVLWSRSPFFYPIGNTPPNCFTATLAPDEDAHVLLLGCGDPRSILYTNDANLAIGNRKMDFTCCDVEPAVIARYILLLTMISDGIDSFVCWRIFYHLYLDEEALQVLTSHCQQILHQSANFNNWNSSKYGAFIRFCTESTLSRLRNLWNRFLEIHALPEKKKASLKASFKTEMENVLQQNAGLGMGTIRAAAPLGPTSSLKAGTEAFKLYWSKGVTTTQFNDIPPSPHLNPLFAYSLAGRNFNVHYGTNPISSFHLASAIANVKGSPFPTTIDNEFLVGAAIRQFSSWCESFRAQTTSLVSRITLRFFVGDALALCRAFRQCHETGITKGGIRASAWSTIPIDLNSNDYGPASTAAAPLSFNIIDTSNLADHLGLLNLLLVTVPLLQRRPWSALHTNTLVQSTPGPCTTALSERVFADIPTLSIFLGVAPASHLSHFTTHSTKDEEAMSAFTGIFSNQFHQLVTWRFTSDVPSQMALPYPELERTALLLTCSSEQLANFLFSVYERMFAEEDLMRGLQNLSLLQSSVNRQNVVHYNRSSFAAFVALIKSRVEVDWAVTMHILLGRIESDKKLIASMNNYQDLCCQLYLHQLCIVAPMTRQVISQLRSSGDIFDGWREVPPVVSVTLKVPRSSLKKVESLRRDEIGLPVLRCETRGMPSQNLHTSITAAFGTFSVIGRGENESLSITEDELGWEGTSPIIVSFDAPSWLFTPVGNVTEVAFAFTSTPNNAKTLIDKLGSFDFKLFAASIKDREHVRICRRRPDEAVEICAALGGFTSGQDDPTKKNVSVVFGEADKIKSLTIRDNIRSEDAKRSLSSGAVVSPLGVTDTGVLVSFQGYKELLRYPFPIIKGKIKTRIARKSSYIEVEAPIKTDFEATNGPELSLNLFPMGRLEFGTNHIW